MHARERRRCYPVRVTNREVRGVSLMSALLLITIVMMVAATMAGVFTVNINITNRVANSSVALSEAEAGLSEVLYLITRTENVDGEENEGEANASSPKVTYGLAGETIRATTTPGMTPEEAYHVVTFNTQSDFPYSTNNTNLDRDTGYNGRIVPDGMLHIISTGFCKGQYRTVECVVEKPPFPFGLASSGPIVSRDPLKVKGTSSLANFRNGEEDRPGHIVCNSPEGITIGSADGLQTEISGFVKSSGPASIAQPAVVRGGVRTFADKTTLADIKISDFNLEGEAGVVTLLDSSYDKPQDLDVMYSYSGGHLQYHDSITLNQAMLWIDGDLTVHGSVKGEGLIVVTGDATFKSGSDLSGTNKMAVLAGGDVTIDGQSNYFAGLVYTEGNLKARNITIVGNAVINSPDPNKGVVDLENVTMVSNEETGDMTIHITSYSDAAGGTNAGHGNPPNPYQGGWVDREGWIGPDVSNEDLDYISENQLLSFFMGPVFGENLTTGVIPPIVYPGDVGNAGGLWADYEALRAHALQTQLDLVALHTQIKDLEGKIKTEKAKDDDDQDDGAIAQWEADLEAIKTEGIPELEEKATAEHIAQGRKFLENLREWARQNTTSDGSLHHESRPPDIVRDERFNLNEYLPESEKIKISFWKVYPRRF